MLVWEAHKQLSEMIGDGVNATASSIPNGVSYSRDERDGYLYKAMLACFVDMHKGITSVAAGGNHNIVSDVIKSWMPYSEHQVVISFENGLTDDYGTIAPASREVPTVTGGGVQVQPVSFQYWRLVIGDNGANVYSLVPAYILSAGLYEVRGDTASDYYLLPVRNNSDVGKFATTMEARRFDPFIVYDYRNMLANFRRCEMKIYGHPSIGDQSRYSHLNISYIPMPIDPATQNPTDQLVIDETQLPKMMTYAGLYADIDSENIEDAASALGVVSGIMQNYGRRG